MLCWRSKEDHLTGRTYAWTNSRRFNTWSERTDIKNPWKDSLFGFSRLFNLHSSVYSHPWPHSTRSCWNCCLQRYIDGVELESRGQPFMTCRVQQILVEVPVHWYVANVTLLSNQTRTSGTTGFYTKSRARRMYIRSEASCNRTAIGSWTFWLSVHVRLYIRMFLFK